MLVAASARLLGYLGINNAACMLLNLHSQVAELAGCISDCCFLSAMKSAHFESAKHFKC